MAPQKKTYKPYTLTDMATFINARKSKGLPAMSLRKNVMGLASSEGKPESVAPLWPYGKRQYRMMIHSDEEQQQQQAYQYYGYGYVPYQVSFALNLLTSKPIMVPYGVPVAYAPYPVYDQDPQRVPDYSMYPTYNQGTFELNFSNPRNVRSQCSKTQA